MSGQRGPASISGQRPNLKDDTGEICCDKLGCNFVKAETELETDLDNVPQTSISPANHPNLI